MKSYLVVCWRGDLVEPERFCCDRRQRIRARRHVHDAGVAHAPKLGDKAALHRRRQQGKRLTVHQASWPLLTARPGGLSPSLGAWPHPRRDTCRTRYIRCSAVAQKRCRLQQDSPRRANDKYDFIIVL